MYTLEKWSVVGGQWSVADKHECSTLSTIDRLAKGNFLGKERVRNFGRLSEGRDLRPDESDTACGCLCPSNIAEGQGRNSTREFLHHLSIAYGSLMEVETQILIAGELKYLGVAEIDLVIEQTAETGRVINGLMRSLRERV